MNRFSCLLLVIAFCVGLSNAAVFKKNSVHFKNSLNPNTILRVCCSSNGDDLGCPILNPGQTREYSFYDSVLKTKIDCTLTKGKDESYQISFRAYEGGGVIVHYGKEYFWDAREDGLYFAHVNETPKLKYTWHL